MDCLLRVTAHSQSAFDMLFFSFHNAYLYAGTVVYNAYMNGLLKGTNSQKVVEIFERMKRDHCEPSTETYTMMINLYGKVISGIYLI